MLFLFLLALFVLLFHPSSLVPVFGIVQVVFVVLGELTPGLEAFPEPVECLDFCDWGVFVAERRYIFVDRKARVIVESLRKQFEKVFRDTRL